MKVKKTNWVMDAETLINCSIFCFVDFASEEKHSFTLWKNVDETDKFFNFLDRNIELQERHITFNGLTFDSQIMQWMLQNRDWFTSGSTRTDEKIKAIYDYAQSCINKSRGREWQDFAPWQLEIPQLDLMAMGHWGGESAKKASLKWLQCALDWHNLQDMPYHHTDYLETRAQMEEVKQYCFNDCFATKKLLYVVREAVDLRRDLTREYGIDLYSASEPRMSKELFLHFLSQKTGIDKREIKKWSTERGDIHVKDVILPYVSFQRQEFIMLLNNFRRLSVRGDSLRGAFEYIVKYRGMEIKYGMGGIHGMAERGVFKGTDTHMIKSVDVKSFYPNMCINNGWAPAHIPKKAFCDQYRWFYDERTKHKKGSAKNKALKLLLNSTFGLTIDKFSFLSDPQMGVTITINGQLLLTMLLEMLCEGIPGAKPLVMNTDGIEIMIRKDQEALCDQICKEWEKITMLTLEFDEYDTILGFDVNNYIAKFKNGKLKGKGRFEYEPHDKYDIDVLHKNKSFLVIPKGVAAFHFEGIKPEDFVKSQTNIFDFCGFARAQGQWKFIKTWSTSEGIHEEMLQKTLRYYVSSTGCKVIKRKVEKVINEDDDNVEVEKNINVLAGRNHITVFNIYEKKEMIDYNIDYNWYVKEIYKELNLLNTRKVKTKLVPKLDLFSTDEE